MIKPNLWQKLAAVIAALMLMCCMALLALQMRANTRHEQEVVQRLSLGLAEHIAQHPGTRPFAWWELEASELRRVRSGMDAPTPHFRGPRFGLAHDYYADHYETETDYLDRLDLLTPEERVALSR